MTTDTTDTIDVLREAIIEACEALDPYHRGPWWPDPIKWDGRPLMEQAAAMLKLDPDLPEDVRARLTEAAAFAFWDAIGAAIRGDSEGDKKHPPEDAMSVGPVVRMPPEDDASVGLVVRMRMRPGAHQPTYQTDGAVGADLHAYLPHGSVKIDPGCAVLVDTGVGVAIPTGYEGQIRPRSGLAYRRGVGVLNAPGTIDSDYRGDIGVLLVNHGLESFSVEHGDRIAQLVISPVVRARFAVATLDETSRGSGGFGSTGTAGSPGETK